MDSTINGKEAVSMRFSPQMLISYTFPTLPEETYTVTWIIEGKKETEAYTCGDMPTHAKPTKAADLLFYYTFKGWTPTVEKVTEDAEYTAIFNKNLYPVSPFYPKPIAPITPVAPTEPANRGEIAHAIHVFCEDVAK